MKLYYDSSFKRGRVEFIADPGMEIEVPDHIGAALQRQDERWKPGKAPAPPAAPAPATAPKAARKTTAKRAAKKSR